MLVLIKCADIFKKDWYTVGEKKVLFWNSPIKLAQLQGSYAGMESMEIVDQFPGIKKYGKWKIKYGKIFMFPDYYHCSKTLFSKIEN